MSRNSLRSLIAALGGGRVGAMPPVRADRRKLDNGDRLRGRIESWTAAIPHLDPAHPGRLSRRAGQSPRGGRVPLFRDSDFLLSPESQEDPPMRMRMGVRVPLAQGPGLGGTLNVDYDNLPAPGKKTTDAALIFQVDYAI